MQIQVNTDNHIAGSEALIQKVSTDLEHALRRYESDITRIEVHLADVNGPKPGEDKRCLLEARLEGRKPIAVSHQALSLDEAIDGATEKLESSLETILGRARDHKGRTSFGGDQTI